MLEETVTECENRVERTERDVCRKKRLRDAELKPEVGLHTAGQFLVTGS